MLQSGLPYTVQVAGSPSNTSNGSRANPVPGVESQSAEPATSISGSIQPLSPRLRHSRGARWAGTPSTRRALYNLDFSIAKKFRFGEARELQFRSEFFNGLNHPQFGLPNVTVGVGGAGTITSTQRSNRQIQFALRLAL